MLRVSAEGLATALVLVVHARTGHAATAGFVQTAVMLPYVLSGPVTGEALDRTRRPQAVLLSMVGCYVLTAAALMAVVGRVPLPVALLIAIVVGSMEPVVVVLTALLPRYVPEERLTRAYGLEASTYNLAAIAGPGMAAGLAAWAGADLAAAAVVGSAVFGLALLPLLAVPAPGQGLDAHRVAEPEPAAGADPELGRLADRAPAPTPAPDSVPPLDQDSARPSDSVPTADPVPPPDSASAPDLASDLGSVPAADWVAPPDSASAAEPAPASDLDSALAPDHGDARHRTDQRASRAASGLGAARSAWARVFGVVAGGLMALVANRVLRAVTAATTLAFLGWGGLAVTAVLLAEHRGGSASVGGQLLAVFAVGALIGSLGAARWLSGRIAEWVLLGGMVAFGLALLAVMAAPSLSLAAACFLVAGLCDGPVFAATLTVRQREAPPERLGQVNTTGGSLKIGSAALGAALTGALADHLGPVGLLGCMAGLHFAGALVGLLLLTPRRRG